jgi:ectoine hydroxylase-related dioxygenase (phytanoyl-CoA dioxygenase family)
MKLSSKQLKSYINNGFLIIKSIFLTEELDILLQAINDSIKDQKINPNNLEGLVLEKNKRSIRTINGLHLKYNIFKELCCYPKLLLLAQQLVRDKDLYIHQFKINFKEAFTGDIWDWHQDYIYWLKGDGMPEPKAISVAILLDDVTEFNGPLMFIPKSHKIGIIDIEPQQEQSEPDQPDWISNVTANLKYPTARVVVAKLAKEFGIVAPKAQKGSILFFDSNILHASTNNLSPFSRRSILITYNPVSNVNLNFSNSRPDFLASRDFTPISVGKDNLLKNINL